MDGAVRKRLGTLAACALLAAACAADGGPGGAAQAAGAGGGRTSGPTVEMNNFSYTPATIRVASGSTITVRNGNAATPHTFTVQGTHVDVEAPPLASTVVTIELPPGEYRFLCRFHAAQGMEGTLVVT